MSIIEEEATKCDSR